MPASEPTAVRYLTLTSLAILSTAGSALGAHPADAPLAAGFPLSVTTAVPFAVLLGVVVAMLSPPRSDR